MKRRFFTLLSAISLLVFVAVVMMWARSYMRRDSIYLFQTKAVHDLESGRGYFCYYVTSSRGCVRWYVCEGISGQGTLARQILIDMMWPTGVGGKWYRESEDSQEPFFENRNSFIQQLGFSLQGSASTLGVPFAVILPYWSLALAFGCLPASSSFSGFWKRRRRQFGHCRSCSYSLTGNTSGVCPECGTKIAIW